jgi:NAD(P)-dependent dehydrogenase (short-subunit alcohol dehydrogenase family)
MRFKGRVAVVTGSGSGIGLATARQFAQDGATVVISDIRADAANDAADAIRAEAADPVAAYPTDSADKAAVAETVESVVKQFGKIDILVNCAGVSFPGPAIEYDRFEQSLAVNLQGTFNWCRYTAASSMIPNANGVIVNVASLAGLAGQANEVGYVASKHGVIGLTKALAIEWAPHQIRVNAVAPGVTETGLTAQIGKMNPELLAARVARVPLGRIGQATDQAGAILFLASDAASYVTGTTLAVDGGQMALQSGMSLNTSAAPLNVNMAAASTPQSASGS